MVYLSEGAKEAYLHYQCHRAPKLYIEKSHQEPQCFSWWRFRLQDHWSGYQQNLKEMDSSCPHLRIPEKCPPGFRLIRPGGIPANLSLYVSSSVPLEISFSLISIGLPRFSIRLVTIAFVPKVCLSQLKQARMAPAFLVLQSSNSFITKMDFTLPSIQHTSIPLAMLNISS